MNGNQQRWLRVVCPGRVPTEPGNRCSPHPRSAAARVLRRTRRRSDGHLESATGQSSVAHVLGGGALVHGGGLAREPSKKDIRPANRRHLALRSALGFSRRAHINDTKSNRADSESINVRRHFGRFRCCDETRHTKQAMNGIHCVVRQPVNCIIQGTEGALIEYRKPGREWVFKTAKHVKTDPLSVAALVARHCHVSCSFRARCRAAPVFKTQRDIVAHYMQSDYIRGRLAALHRQKETRHFEAAVTLLASLCAPTLCMSGLKIETAGRYRAAGLQAMGVPVGTHDQVLGWLQVQIARGNTPAVLLRRPDAIAATMVGAVIGAAGSKSKSGKGKRERSSSSSSSSSSASSAAEPSSASSGRTPPASSPRTALVPVPGASSSSSSSSAPPNASSKWTVLRSRKRRRTDSLDYTTDHMSDSDRLDPKSDCEDATAITPPRRGASGLGVLADVAIGVAAKGGGDGSAAMGALMSERAVERASRLLGGPPVCGGAGTDAQVPAPSAAGWKLGAAGGSRWRTQKWPSRWL